MKITRREFLRYCGLSTAALGMGSLEMLGLEKALANPMAPSVIWIQGSSCTGCSISLLNRIADTAPQTATEVLTDSINLVFHPELMGPAGESAVAMLKQACAQGPYILVVEGGVPTAFDGHACVVWSYEGEDVTFQQAVKELAPKAAHVVCVGTCSSFGGIPKARPNPTGIVSVGELTGLRTINISGCPAHPDWIVWAIVQLLLGKSVALDDHGRPLEIYGKKIHKTCPFKEREEADTFGIYGMCLKEIGCRGPDTYANCHVQRWNNGVSWCVEAGAPCLGCTEPDFPGTKAFIEEED